MDISAKSIVITIFIWYLLIGTFNLVYLGVTKKLNDLNWLKFILENFGLVVVYFFITAISFTFAGSSSLSVPIFMGVNILALFVCVATYAKYVLKLENYQFIYYSLFFTLIFNLFWYRFLGVL